MYSGVNVCRPQDSYMKTQCERVTVKGLGKVVSGALTRGVISLGRIQSSSQLFQPCDPEQDPYQNLAMLAPGLGILPLELRKAFPLFTTHPSLYLTCHTSLP